MLKRMETQNIYRSNIEALRNLDATLSRQLESMAYESKPYRHSFSKTGLPVLEITRNSRSTALCSKVDPQREAQRLIQSHLHGSEQLVVLFGLGLGYHLQEMLEKNSEAHFVVVEPNLELFSEILKTRDISDIIHSKRVTLLIEPKAYNLDELSPHSDAANMTHVVLRPYRVLFETEAVQAEQDFYAYANSKKINRATLKRFDRLWTKNTFKNCHYFFTHGGVSLLQGRFRGMPAIVVAAGPSVEKDLTCLKQYSDGCVVVAVDTVVNTLLNRDIRPDFAVTVDPQLINCYHLASMSVPSGAEPLPILVADPAVYPTVLRTYRGDVLITSSVFSPGRIIEQFTDAKGSIAAGGSVATAAFDLARIMGADPVFLMGLDLSFSGLKTHISGSYVERFIQSHAHRLKTIPTFSGAYIRGGNPTFFKDKSGSIVLSDSRMQLYRAWFERQMKQESSTVLNASRNGLSIEGIPDVVAEEIGSRINVTANKHEIIGAIRKEIVKRQVHSDGAHIFIQYLAQRQDDLHSIESLAKKAVSVCRALKKKPSPETESKLASLEQRIVSFSDCSRLIDMVMQEPINEALSQEPAKNINHALSRSIALYEAIEEAARFVYNLLTLAEERLKGKLKLQLH